MNELELLQGRVALMESELRKLKILFGADQARTADHREAQRLAEKEGFSVEVLALPARRGRGRREPNRRKLALQLRMKGWSYERIARVFGCAEKTARRWTA